MFHPPLPCSRPSTPLIAYLVRSAHSFRRPSFAFLSPHPLHGTSRYPPSPRTPYSLRSIHSSLQPQRPQVSPRRPPRRHGERTELDIDEPYPPTRRGGELDTEQSKSGCVSEVPCFSFHFPFSFLFLFSSFGFAGFCFLDLEYLERVWFFCVERDSARLVFVGGS